MSKTATAVRQAVGPSIWPSPPTEMSVSTLRELEACPRRWALSNAKYPEIWNRPGYPPKLNIAALAGSVIHMALERATKRLSEVGCPSVSDPSAVTIMKELGGYTALARSCITNVLKRFEGNLRAEPYLEDARYRLESALSEIRTRIQALISRVRLEPRDTLTSEPSHGGGMRSLLGPGSHAEITLRAQKLRWIGVADLISLSQERCEIRDFKTGQERDEHAFQLRVYALLWWRDAELNPSARRADSLILSYSSGDVSVDAPGVCQKMGELADYSKRESATFQALPMRLFPESPLVFSSL